MSVTIKDIALRVGTSHVSVSHALRGSGRLGAETRSRILAAAKEMGYRPNNLAQAMREGRFGNIGLLLSADTRRSNLPHQLLNGIESELASRDFHLTLGRLADAELTRSGFVPKLLRSWSADGLLINYQEDIPSEMIALIEGDQLPAVWINSKQRGACVYVDDFGAGRRAAEYLIQHGHRRIVFLDLIHSSRDLTQVHYSVTDRQAGYEAVMRDAGLPVQVIRNERVLDNRERPIACRHLLAAEGRPSAFICYSASMGIPLAVAAMETGLSIPRDLSIVTFDDAPMGALGFTFTTFIVPQEELGRTAVALLVDQIEATLPAGPASPVPFVLEAGDSVAQIASSGQ